MARSNRYASGLSKWAGEDKPTRSDFNEDNRIIDSYISSNSEIPIDRIYPIGSIYLSVSPVNPEETIGGTWVTITNTLQPYITCYTWKRTA